MTEQDKKTAVELSIDAPAIPRFIIKFRHPDNTNADTDGWVWLQYDTLDVLAQLHRSGLITQTAVKLSKDKMAEYVLKCLKATYEIFGLDKELITQDQALKVIGAFLAHLRQHGEAIKHISSEAFTQKKLLKKKH